MKQKSSPAVVAEALKFWTQLGKTWLSDLSTVDPEEHSPANPIDDGETVIGQMTDLEKRLFALGVNRKRMVKMLEISITFDTKRRSAEETRKLEQTRSELLDQEKVCRELMWTVLRDRFPDRTGDAIGVREGGAVVSFSDNALGESGPARAARGLARLLADLAD